ncbi:MAG: SH3 domain-containing protein [Coriobacteriia bacterium]|nr:SH3 domain-containing protein [Coriobacteriia bacterium]
MSNEDYGYEQPLVTRIVRMVVPWILLALVAMVAWNLLGDYREAASGTVEPGETSGTVEATETPTAEEPGEPAAETPEGETPAEPVVYVRVITEGLNMRSQPMTTSTVIKTLKADQRLVLLEKGSGWYRVRDDAGDEGWVAAGGRYTELVE